MSLSRFLSGMMRLCYHETVTGGTPHDWVTVHRAAVPPAGVPGVPAPATRRVSAAGPALRGRLPRPAGGGAEGWDTADGAPVARLHPRSAPAPGSAAGVPPHLPPTLCPPGGARARLREGAGDRPPGAAWPPPWAAGGPPGPWRGPGRRPGRPRPAPGGLGGGRGDQRRTRSGGAAAPRQRAGGPPGAHEGPARRRVRPQAPLAQHASESGKHSAPTSTNGRLVEALRRLRLRAPHGGRPHARRLAAAPPCPRPAGRGVWQARACLACPLPAGALLRPPTQPRGGEGSLAQARTHQARHQRRRRSAPVTSSVTRGRSVKDRVRWWKAGGRARVRERCGAWPHVRVRLHPWLPMISSG